MKTADEQSSNNDTSTRESIKTIATHELDILGKTVPTLAVAALLLIGGGSAAVLSSFGSVSGTADVDKAVTFEQDSPKFSFDGTQTAGEEFIDTQTLTSNADVATSVSLVSRQVQGEQSDLEGLDQSEYTSTFEGVREDFNGFDIPYDFSVRHYAGRTVWESNVEETLSVDRPFHVVRLEVDVGKDETTDVEKVISDDETTEISQPFVSREKLPAGAEYNFTFTFENTQNDNDRFNLVPKKGESLTDTVKQKAFVEGIDTRVVEYYDDAGHDFSGYRQSVPESDNTVTNGDNIQEAINGADSGSTVVVEGGDYEPFTVDTSGLTIVAANSPTSDSSADIRGSDNGIEIGSNADGATVRGFNVSTEGNTKDRRGILVKAKDVTVDSNYVHGVDAGDRAIGIYVYGHDGSNHAYDVSGTVVSNNLVEDVEAGQTGDNDGPKSAGITVTENSGTENSADDVSVTGNTVRDVGGSSSETSAGVEVDGGNAQNFEITYNNISNIKTDPSKPDSIPTGVYVTGYTSGGASFGEEHGINFNNLLNTEETGGLEVGVLDVKRAVSNSGRLNALDNYWGSDGSATAQQSQLDALISSSFEDKFRSQIPADGEDKFAVINDFAINLEPKGYSVETRAEPIV